MVSFVQHPWVIKTEESYASVSVPSVWNVNVSKYAPKETRPAMLVFPTLDESLSFRNKYIEILSMSVSQTSQMSSDNATTIRMSRNLNSVAIRKHDCICTRMTNDPNMIDFSVKNHLAYLIITEACDSMDILTLQGFLMFPENFIDDSVYDDKAIEHLFSSYYL